jgi:hypothetical protein
LLSALVTRSETTETSRDEDKIFRYRKIMDGGFAAVL